MQNASGGKTPNIRLREGKSPITVSGFSNVGATSERLRFPTLARQENGWYLPGDEAKRIVECYPDRYELINGGCKNC